MLCYVILFTYFFIDLEFFLMILQLYDFIYGFVAIDSYWELILNFLCFNVTT